MILFETHLFPEKRRQFTNTGECRALRAFLADQYAPLGDRWTITGYFQVGSWDIQKTYRKDHGSSKFGSRFSQRHELTTAYNQYKQREVWAGHLPMHQNEAAVVESHGLSFECCERGRAAASFVNAIRRFRILAAPVDGTGKIAVSPTWQEISETNRWTDVK